MRKAQKRVQTSIAVQRNVETSFHRYTIPHRGVVSAKTRPLAACPQSVGANGNTTWINKSEVQVELEIQLKNSYSLTHILLRY